MSTRANAAKSDIDTSRFLADGYWRTRRHCEPAIRAAVEKEFEPILATSSAWRRFFIRREMQREIERRLDQAAPPEALY